MSDRPMTATEIAQGLARLGRDMDQAVSELDDADRDAVEKREAHTLDYAKAFLKAEGSMDVRRYIATEQTHDSRLAAEAADQVVRGLRRRLDALRTRIEIGRSVNAALRSEHSLASTPGLP